MSPVVTTPPDRRRRRLAPIGHGDLDCTPVAEDLNWLHDILGAAPDGQTTEYLGRVAGGELRLLVPTRPAPAAAAAMRRPNSDRSPVQWAQSLVGQAVGRLGLAPRVPGRRLMLAPFELVDHLARVLGQPGLVAAVTLGPRRRNRKPVLQLLRPDGHVVGYAKVGWSALTTELVDNEADVLRLLEGRLSPSVVAPVMLHHETWRTRSVAVASPLRPGRYRFGRGPTMAEIVWSIAACDQPVRGAVAELTAFEQWADAGLDHDVDLDQLRNRHGDVELQLGLWHGDLTPWNMAMGNTSALVWDWEFAQTGRPVGFDVLHHHFEKHRRAPRGTSQTALTALVAEADEVLEPLGLGLRPNRRDALLDLYLCELLARERRLSAQQWNGQLADLGPAALGLLRQRLG